MNTSNKLFFILPSLRGGGEERVVLNILNNIDKVFEVYLITLSSVKNYDLPNTINLINLDKNRARKSILTLFNLIRKEKPRIVFGVGIQITMILGIIKIFCPSFILINSVQNFYSKENLNLKKRLMFFNSLRLSNYILPVSDEIKNDLVNRGFNKNKIHRIYNFIDENNINELKKEEVTLSDGINIIACGRLVEQKAFHILIKAIKKLKNYNIHLYILGQGEKKEELMKLIKKLNLNNKIVLLGFRKNPFKYMSASDIYVSSSLWEGLSLASVEAMECGLPMVLTDCKSGPKEILDHGKYGILVNPGDVNSLKEGLELLIKDKNKREYFSRLSKERAKDFYSSKIIKEYNKFFYEATKQF